MDSQAADEWIRFLREYAPIPRQSNMYAEEMFERAEKMGIKPLEFEHPAKAQIAERFAPDSDRLTNVILTGTAGEGKTQFLYDLWLKSGGNREDLRKKPKFLEHTLHGSGGAVQVVFVFDLSKCVPESGQQWQERQITLVERFAEAMLSPQKVKFLVAANDGKLLQALRSIKALRPDSCAAKVEPEIEEMLARKRDSSPQLDLYLLDLSGIASAEVLSRARRNLLDRPEWACFTDCSSDPAYGPGSPLTRNFALLSSDLFYGRLRSLIELCDVNGMHISVRDLIALLVNGLLGHPDAGAGHMMTPEFLREVAHDSIKAGAGIIHRNILGENFPEHQREGSAAFEYLQYFRIGQETSNAIDELLLFGKDIEALQPKYSAIVEDSSGLDPVSLKFETLRRDYLDADDFDERKRETFMSELAAQRRRLFFRIPSSETADFDPWQLTVFQNSAAFLSGVLAPLEKGDDVDPVIIEKIVLGLNRIWSGMLFEDGSHLYLTSGLDFTSSKISRLALHKVPVSENLHGEKICVGLTSRHQPELLVYLLSGEPVRYRLDLMRFEFILRVADGALPNSFSRECYEDMINFKGVLLRRLEAASSGRRARLFNYLSVDESGRPQEEMITL
jgi:hypothetical protein